MNGALPRPACVLFDLDGTLLDTAPDMARALNRLLQEEGRGPLPFAAIRPVVSHGSRGLLGLGFDLTPDAPAYGALQQRFLAIYSTSLAAQTVLFPGMEAVLQALEQRAIPWGVVTNKPAWLTEPLLAALALAPRSACTVSGDTLAQRKPDPAPLLHACRHIGVAPERCVYIGDAERDVAAGRNAGMYTLVARYGYLYPHEVPHEWGADGLIDHPDELAGWFGGC